MVSAATHAPFGNRACIDRALASEARGDASNSVFGDCGESFILC
jgi:hypothetical protein